MALRAEGHAESLKDNSSCSVMVSPRPHGRPSPGPCLSPGSGHPRTPRALALHVPAPYPTLPPTPQPHTSETAAALLVLTSAPRAHGPQGQPPRLVPDLPPDPVLGPQSEEPEGRSYSTLTTVRETETQTELLTPGSSRAEDEDGRDEGIKQAMTHFVQENGTLRAKPSGNGIYINGRGHLV